MAVQPLRVNPSPDEGSADSSTRRIVALCDRHGLRYGALSDLAPFMQALSTNKHLAMDFWSLVASHSDQAGSLAISVVNGHILELVTNVVTGHAVAELIAAGSEQRRLVGELGGLLAGEDLSSPLAPSAASPPPSPVEPPTPIASEVEKLKADLEDLRTAFESRFGVARYGTPIRRPAPPATSPEPFATNSALQAVEPQSRQLLASPQPATPISLPPAAQTEPKSATNHPRQSFAASLASATSLPPATALPSIEQLVSPEPLQESPAPAEKIACPIVYSAPRSEINLHPSSPARPTPSAAPPAAKPTPASAAKPASVAPLTPLPLPTLFRSFNQSAEPDSTPEDSEPRSRTRLILLILALSIIAICAALYATDRAGLLPFHLPLGQSAAITSPSPPLKSSLVVTPEPDLPDVATPPPSAPPAIPRSNLPSPTAKSLPVINSGLYSQSVISRNTPDSTSTSPPSLASGLAGMNPQATASLIPVPASPNVVSQAPTAPIVRATAAPPIFVASNLMQASRIYAPNPEYPDRARAAHIFGQVIIDATITRSGNVAKLSVVSGPLGLRESAINAVSRWKYRPYLLNGEAIDIQTRITVQFNINYDN